MALVDSLLTAMIRAGGDALVLHVGDRPYVVTRSGPVDLSARPLHLSAITGMLQQLLSPEAQRLLAELGAVEHQLPALGEDRFTVVAARGGDDVWIEIRRRRGQAPQRAAQPVTAPPPVLQRDVAAAPDSTQPEPDRAPAVALAPAAQAAAQMPATVPAPPAAPPGPPVSIAPQEPAPAPAVAASVSAVVAEPGADRRLLEPQQVGVAPATDAAPLVCDVAPAAPPPTEPDERVVPLTRTVRIEVPPRAATARVGTAERLLRLAAARGASSLLLATGVPPYLRLEGDLRPLEPEPALTKTDIEAALLELGPAAASSGLSGSSSLPHDEWIAEIEGIGRVRGVTFVDHRGPGAVFHLIATRAATAEQLGLPPEVQALATEAEGLVVVAAPRGSGKSTLLSALVDLVNRQRADYVITLERQIRLVHDRRQAFISQREIRGSADDALAAARAALREDPDVLVVDDVPLAPLATVLVDAAGQGLLVFVSVTAPSTADALGRLVDAVAPDSRPAVQAALAESFRGAVAQVLLKKVSGGRIAAREVLLGTAAVSRLVAEGSLSQLSAAIESGRKHGMVGLTEALVQVVQAAGVDIREAYRKAPDRERLLAALKRQGVDTSLVERLA